MHSGALPWVGDDEGLPTQELYFVLMARSSFNDFDGPQVVRDLQAHPECWHAVVMVSANLDVQLRDLPLEVCQLDTLYIATDEPHVAAIEDLARRWLVASIERCRPGSVLGFGAGQRRVSSCACGGTDSTRGRGRRWHLPPLDLE